MKTFFSRRPSFRYGSSGVAGSCTDQGQMQWQRWSIWAILAVASGLKRDEIQPTATWLPKFVGAYQWGAAQVNS